VISVVARHSFRNLFGGELGVLLGMQYLRPLDWVGKWETLLI
jgi:hypothetical protein